MTRSTVWHEASHGIARPNFHPKPPKWSKTLPKRAPIVTLSYPNVFSQKTSVSADCDFQQPQREKNMEGIEMTLSMAT